MMMFAPSAAANFATPRHLEFVKPKPSFKPLGLTFPQPHPRTQPQTQPQTQPRSQPHSLPEIKLVPDINPSVPTKPWYETSDVRVSGVLVQDVVVFVRDMVSGVFAVPDAVFLQTLPKLQKHHAKPYKRPSDPRMDLLCMVLAEGRDWTVNDWTVHDIAFETQHQSGAVYVHRATAEVIGVVDGGARVEHFVQRGAGPAFKATCDTAEYVRMVARARIDGHRKGAIVALTPFSMAPVNELPQEEVHLHSAIESRNFCRVEDLILAGFRNHTKLSATAKRWCPTGFYSS